MQGLCVFFYFCISFFYFCINKDKTARSDLRLKSEPLSVSSEGKAIHMDTTYGYNNLLDTTNENLLYPNFDIIRYS